MSLQPFRRLGVALAIAFALPTFASAQEFRPFRRFSRPVVTRSAARPATPSGLQPTPMLGTFYETPYMTVGGNGESGFTPLSQYGGGTLSLYGPFSALRATAAPVVTYTRGYDGIVRPETSTSFSYPFLPAASPVVYPTCAQVRGASTFQTTPPWWDTGHGWVDMR